MLSGVIHKQLLQSKKEKLTLNSSTAKMLRWWLSFSKPKFVFKFFLFPGIFSLFYFCGDWRSDILNTFHRLLISANKFYKQTKVTQNPKTIYIKHVVFT